MNPVTSALPAQRLESHIADSKPNYIPGDAVAEANRCLYCHDAPCVTACPTGIDIPTFIRKIGTGNLTGSARTILSANLLGYSCARVCPVEALCVGACVYNAWHRNPPIQIGRLQRFAVESVFANGSAATLLSKAAPNGKKVVCVGAGPASLACAGYLALEGCSVTLLEKRAIAGGLNVTGVAPYKMDATGALAELAYIQSLGVTIQTGVEVGKDVTPEQLLKDHDAVFVGVGLGGDSKLGIPGEAGPGVFGGVEWVEKMKLESGYALEGVRRAVVIGGGNTAIDVVRELAKLGVPDVALLYRRTEADMPGYRHELELARKEGVRLVERAVPASFVRTGDKLAAVALADGREVACDLCVVAIGQGKLGALVSSFPGVATSDKGLALGEPMTGTTGNPKVWVGGDVTGGELVVTAAQDGKRAARSIAAALGIKARENAPYLAGHR
ncbi:MAG: FAD-dependent oxidoreductase [Candidatus Eisenbacteria bacterium]|nr:FAD-dependent oxidoreductase [Candidatus Eisenbacteria bacterium]